MKASDLILRLESIINQLGDLPVRVYEETELAWYEGKPEINVKEGKGGQRYISISSGEGTDI